MPVYLQCLWEKKFKSQPAFHTFPIQLLAPIPFLLERAGGGLASWGQNGLYLRRRIDLSEKEQRKQKLQTHHQNECLVRMDEERKTLVSHDEMCFPDWLNEARGIKRINQPLRCLGSTWTGLLMRPKQAKS